MKLTIIVLRCAGLVLARPKLSIGASEYDPCPDYTTPQCCGVPEGAVDLDCGIHLWILGGFESANVDIFMMHYYDKWTADESEETKRKVPNCMSDRNNELQQMFSSSTGPYESFVLQGRDMRIGRARTRRNSDKETRSNRNAPKKEVKYTVQELDKLLSSCRGICLECVKVESAEAGTCTDHPNPV
ncbi:hypothetical protein ANO11243_071520 [Dothideomycetidae sp. 11243]|nr:hypothetical protein ANO11243_071520 [fungal sp. No.11243]